MKAYLKVEMPTSCCECAIKSWDGEDDVCPFSGISALSIGRQDDCPLVPIPPHGRLIDADAFIKDECNNCDGACEAILCDCLNCTADYRCEFMKDIADAPTIIPADTYDVEEQTFTDEYNYDEAEGE